MRMVCLKSALPVFFLTCKNHIAKYTSTGRKNNIRRRTSGRDSSVGSLGPALDRFASLSSEDTVRIRNEVAVAGEKLSIRRTLDDEKAVTPDGRRKGSIAGLQAALRKDLLRNGLLYAQAGLVSSLQHLTEQVFKVHLAHFESRSIHVRQVVSRGVDRVRLSLQAR